MKNLPEFIIMGAMKSATSTLYEQLNSQPGIFMSVPKEPNYFSDDKQYKQGVNWYNTLFSGAKDTDLVGEASTHYSKLPTYPNTIKRMQDTGINARLIYIMRHPVDRLVSHYMHEFSQGVITCDINTAIVKYKSLTQYSLYSMQLKPYIEQYGLTSILPVFFDSLRAQPQKELERICKFIGYEKMPEWKTDLAPSNVSSKRIKKFPFYNIIVNSILATWLRRTFVPKSIRNRIKKSLSLKKRPELDCSNLNDLEQIFNQDLKIIGDWLGVEINCKNFKDKSSNSHLEWKL